MNSKHIVFSSVLGLFALSLGAQEKSKTFKETFKVSDDAVLEINTSHADIEFETWDKDQVEITAVIELDGATDEEATTYFEKIPIEIIGNSREIEISTSSRNTWELLANNDFDIHIEKAPKLELLFEDLEMPWLSEMAVLPEMPELTFIPSIPLTNFDYEAFKKDGDAYMKKWKKDFDKNFGKKYQKRMEEWGKRMEERAKKWEERNAERLELLKENAEKRAKAMEERREALEERREALREQREELREELRNARRDGNRSLFISRDDTEAPSIFYFSSDGEKKKFKVKKSIKVKMPKSVKLKMNVRHGEVKLAGTTKNLNASLRYASLLASTIDGNHTDIQVSYSPVAVKNWNYGKLNTKHCNSVQLGGVEKIDLKSISSNITIDQVKNNAKISNDLGSTVINTIDDDFERLVVSLKNGELKSRLPKGKFNIYLWDERSDIITPEGLPIKIIKNHPTIQGDFDTGINNKRKYPSIIINSKYSEVVLED